MYHMLSCFNLQPGVSLEEFQRAMAAFADHLQEQDLIESMGPIGRRDRHPIMDTWENELEYFFLMSFRDREQCDQSTDHILPQCEPADSLHEAVYTKVKDPVFICWADI